MLPQAFLDRMEQMLGGEYPAFLQSYEKERYQALRVNPLKADRDVFEAAAPFTLRPVAWEPNGFYYGKEAAPGKHPYHAAGVYYIQGPSAMAPAAYLDAQPGEKILDLCAAPGGKSTQIAAAMRGEGLLISNEIHPARAKILSENIERMGIRNAMVTNESPQSLAKVFEAYFDRIMVDAPCSGEGMFRKNADACDEWSPENVVLCAERQAEILECAASMLRPGGRMVYSTCTFAPKENEGTISQFLAKHPEFELQMSCIIRRCRPVWRRGRLIRSRDWNVRYVFSRIAWMVRDIILRILRRRAVYRRIMKVTVPGEWKKAFRNAMRKNIWILQKRRFVISRKEI